MKTTVYLVRHSVKATIPVSLSPTEYDRIQPLSAEGERRARQLLNLAELRSADAAWCSPFARTVSTLRYIAEEDHLSLTIDDRLRELDFGDIPAYLRSHAEEMGTTEDISRFLAKQWDDRDLAAPGGESIHQCSARMTDVLRDIVRKHSGQTILVGTHGAAIGAFLSSVIDGIDDRFTRQIPQPAVFCLQYEDGQFLQVERLPTEDLSI